MKEDPGKVAQTHTSSSAGDEVEGPLLFPPHWLAAAPLYCPVPFQGIPEIYLEETGV